MIIRLNGFIFPTLILDKTRKKWQITHIYNTAKQAKYILLEDYRDYQETYFLILRTV